MHFKNLHVAGIGNKEIDLWLVTSSQYYLPYESG